MGIFFCFFSRVKYFWSIFWRIRSPDVLYLHKSIFCYIIWTQQKPVFLGFQGTSKFKYCSKSIETSLIYNFECVLPIDTSYWVHALLSDLWWLCNDVSVMILKKFPPPVVLLFALWFLFYYILLILMRLLYAVLGIFFIMGKMGYKSFK